MRPLRNHRDETIEFKSENNGYLSQSALIFCLNATYIIAFKTVWNRRIDQKLVRHSQASNTNVGENEEPAGGFWLNIRHGNIVYYTHRWCYNIHCREKFTVSCSVHIFRIVFNLILALSRTFSLSNTSLSLSDQGPWKKLPDRTRSDYGDLYLTCLFEGLKQTAFFQNLLEQLSLTTVLKFLPLWSKLVFAL